MSDRFDFEDLLQEIFEEEAPAALPTRRLPPSKNYRFSSAQAAKQAALRYAASLGQGFRVHDHVYPTLNLRHFHIQAPDGRFLRVRFFYRADVASSYQELDHELSAFVQEFQ